MARIALPHQNPSLLTASYPVQVTTGCRIFHWRSKAHQHRRSQADVADLNQSFCAALVQGRESHRATWWPMSLTSAAQVCSDWSDFQDSRRVCMSPHLHQKNSKKYREAQASLGCRRVRPHTVRAHTVCECAFWAGLTVNFPPLSKNFGCAGKHQGQR
jgi:hypothetical protein